MSATDQSGVRERLVEAAVEAAREAQGAIPGSSYQYPESVARTVGFHVLAAVLPLIADEIEREGSDPDAAWSPEWIDGWMSGMSDATDAVRSRSS